ncbi:MAG: hypothetical protein FJX67_02235 [Alphaproteobacteria bacterium]|nr:hypothetical protein [Alphaproteobacteria bacterium]
MAFLYSVSINDPTSALQPAHFNLLQATQAALATWSNFVDGKGSLEVELRIGANAGGLSVADAFTTFLEVSPTRVLAEPNVTHELRTGNDLNGPTVDLVLHLDPGFYASRTWLDPFPFNRLGAVPDDRLDLVSLLAYTVGEGMGFTGFGNPATGVRDTAFLTTFDAKIEFTGAAAVAAHGGPIPLNTQGANPLYVRLGNGPLDGLGNNLMTSEIVERGERKVIGPVDLAVMRDLGLPTVDLETNPVFRFYNTETGVHFYTASAAERDNVIATLDSFQFEGTGFGVPAGNQAPTATVFRFYNTATGTHFYTISPAERDNVIATLPQYNFEGPAFSAYTAPVPGSVPLYRFYNGETGAHFYTAGLLETNAVSETLPQFRFEGLAWFVDPFVL